MDKIRIGYKYILESISSLELPDLYKYYLI